MATDSDTQELRRQRTAIIDELKRAESMVFFGNLYPGSHEPTDEGFQAAQTNERQKKDLLTRLAGVNDQLGLPLKSRIDFRPSGKGSAWAEFRDENGSACSLQKSSSPTKDVVLFGVDVDSEGRPCSRMRLTQEQVAVLLPHLQHFVETGELV